MVWILLICVLSLQNEKESKEVSLLTRVDFTNVNDVDLC